LNDALVNVATYFLDACQQVCQHLVGTDQLPVRNARGLIHNWFDALSELGSIPRSTIDAVERLANSTNQFTQARTTST
jgi:hypothetical protein